MLLFLDACVVIYWIEAADPFHSRLMTRLKELRKRAPEATFAVSRLSWIECLVKPLRDSDDDLVAEYRAFFRAGQLRVVELTADVVEHAASLRAQSAIKTPDALQAASALSLGSDAIFLTNDKRLSKITGLQVEVIG